MQKAGMDLMKTGFAYFVRRPRRAEELTVPHLPEHERAYEVVKTVTLSDIDYTNFITDMLADRQFIEDNGEICSFGESCKCMLVKPRGGDKGVLVVPENLCFVGWAANWN